MQEMISDPHMLTSCHHCNANVDPSTTTPAAAYMDDTPHYFFLR